MTTLKVMTIIPAMNQMDKRVRWRYKCSLKGGATSVLCIGGATSGLCIGGATSGLCIGGATSVLL